MGMYYNLDKNYDETFTITFIGTEEFGPSDTLKLTMESCVLGIKTLEGYTHNVQGETETEYLRIFLRYKYEGEDEWSDNIPIDEINTLEFCETKCLLLQLLYFRIDENGPNSGVTITLSNPSINGTFEYTTGDEFVILTPADPIQILETGDLLKIFSIDNFLIISTPSMQPQTFTIKYRFSQDDQLSWTQWEPLTVENISTVKWDKTRFVELQYLFELSPGARPVKIYEVILYGDFQNVTLNSTKINLFGLKENCVNLAFPPAAIGEATSGINDSLPYDSKSLDSTTNSLVKETSEYQLRMNWLTQGLQCYSNPATPGGLSVIDQLNMENENNSDGFWNPYEFDKITKWHEMLAGQISEMLGMPVEYHLTDPDGNGIDKVVHEQQLFNVTDYKMIKVLVPENQFPDNQVIINQFNLDLFDTFKINILKTDFKKAFGVHKRPSQEDILYFCQINRMYIVKHAQIHKDVMNSGIYYNVILEKYEKRANVINRVEESKSRIEELTRNTTIDDLFGFEEEQDFKKVANKEQLKPKTTDLIRSVINPRTRIINENINNGDIKVLDGYYDISNVGNNEYAVKYTKADNELKVSDNRSFIFWFNIPNEYDENRTINSKVLSGYDLYVDQDTDGDLEDIYKYVLINNTKNEFGYKIWAQKGKIYFTINDEIYSMEADLLTNVWYVLLVNLDQRQRTVEMKLLRRNTELLVVMFNPDTYERVEIDYKNTDEIQDYINDGFKPVTNLEISSTEVNPSFIEEISYFKENINISNFKHDEDLIINGSNMKISNIRIFDDLIRDDKQNFVLNELIIKDSQHLILGDNANQKLYTTKYPNKNWR